MIDVTKETGLVNAMGATPLPSSGVARVLIVDDEIGTRKLLAAMLGDAGVLCKTAACAEEGLKVLETESVDAVLSDLQMPGISGMAFLAEVRPRYRHLAFLMITGMDDIRVGIEAMKRGADDYLVKPLQVEIVIASLERALEKKRLEQELG
jgi:DNA-binding NtrC family response regulator